MDGGVNWLTLSGVMHCYFYFSTLENKLVGFADDSTLMAVVPSQALAVQ